MGRSDSEKAIDRQLKDLIDHANGPFKVRRFRDEIAASLREGERPIAICLVEGLQIDDEVQVGRERWVLVTDRQLVFIQVGLPDDVPRLSKVHTRCFPVTSVQCVSQESDRRFQVILEGGTVLTIRGRPWPDTKFTKAVHGAIAAQVENIA